MKTLTQMAGGFLIALICLSAHDANAVVLVAGPDGTVTNSWERRLATADNIGFDRLEFVYRADLDMGGGMFQSPHIDTFRSNGGASPGAVNWGGMVRNDWQQTSGWSTFARAQGPQVSAEWLPFMLNYTGNGDLYTGFDIAFYRTDTFLGAFELQWKRTGVFNLANSIDESVYDQHRQAAVPEPSTVLIMGMGLGFAAILRRRRRVA